MVVASHNAGKVREISTLLTPFKIETRAAADLGLGEPIEDGTSFIANAEIKARAAAQASNMVALADDLNFDPCEELTNEMVKRKTITAKAVIETTTKALEASGGPGYIRGQVIERLVRDSFACQFHPMQEKRQLLFSGRMAMGLPPIAANEMTEPENG